MSLFDDPQGKDLFDNLLENPDLPMSVNQTIQTFIEKLQSSELLTCAICFRPLSDKVFLYTHAKMYCVICFADHSDPSEPYLIINLGRRLFRHSRWSALEELEVLQLMQNYGVDNYEEIARNMPNKMSSEHIQKYQSKVFDFLPSSEAEVAVKATVEPWRRLSNKLTNYLTEEYSVLDYMIGHLHEQSDPEMAKFLLAKKRQQDLQKQKAIKHIEGIAKNYPHGGTLFEREEAQEAKNAKIFQQKMKAAEELVKVTEELLKECDEVILQRQVCGNKRGRKRKVTMPTIQPTKIKRIRKARTHKSFDLPIKTKRLRKAIQEPINLPTKIKRFRKPRQKLNPSPSSTQPDV